MFACIVVLLATSWLLHFEQKDINKAERKALSLQSYAVFLPWVPSWATEAQLRRHFERVLPTDPDTKQPPKIADVTVVQNNFYLMSMFMRHGKLRTSIDRQEAAAANLAFDDLAWWECACWSRERRIEAMRSQAAELRKQKQLLDKRLRRYRAVSKAEMLARIAEDLQEDVDQGRAGGCLCWSTGAQLDAIKAEMSQHSRS